MDDDMKVIFIISIFVYIIGIAWCSYCLSTKKRRSECFGNCFKYIKKYNCFGDRVDEDPRIYYDEIV